MTGQDQAAAPGEVRDIVPATQAIWDAKAAFWDARMADGNAFQRELIGPATEQLLAIQPGEQVIDIACGNGVMARRLATLGGVVTACDFSPEFLARAASRSQAAGLSIAYALADATNEVALAALGEGQFAAAVCNMALMDMPAIAPLFRAVARLLQPGGRLVVAVSHPAFNTNGMQMQLTAEDRAGELVQTRALTLTGYRDIPPGLGCGMPGEPAPHWYFPRSFQDLLMPCFAAGLVLDGLLEPAFDGTTADPADPLSWRSFTQFPPVLVVRARRLPASIRFPQP